VSAKKWRNVGSCDGAYWPLSKLLCFARISSSYEILTFVASALSTEQSDILMTSQICLGSRQSDSEVRGVGLRRLLLCLRLGGSSRTLDSPCKSLFPTQGPAYLLFVSNRPPASCIDVAKHPADAAASRSLPGACRCPIGGTFPPSSAEEKSPKPSAQDLSQSQIGYRARCSRLRLGA
jgi:hypothetical protein